MGTDELIVLRNGKVNLIGKITDLLGKNAFSSSYTLSPFMFGEVASEIAEGLLAYLDEANDDSAIALGERLAEIGLAGRTLAEVSPILRRFVMELLAASPTDHFEELLEPLDAYLAALVDGFVAGRESHVMQEQERTRRALDAANKASLRALLLKSTAVDNSSAAIAMVDHASTVVYANRAMADLLGLTAPAEVEGKSLTDSIDGAGVEQALHRVKGGAAWRGEASLRTASPKSSSVMLAVSRVDGAGEPSIAMVVAIPAGT